MVVLPADPTLRSGRQSAGPRDPGYWNRRDGERITEPKWSWLIDDERESEIYYAECREELVKAGYGHIPVGHCPALIRESVLRDTEKVLVDAACKFFPGMTWDKIVCSGLDNLEKFIDLLCGLVVNAPGYKPVKL